MKNKKAGDPRAIVLIFSALAIALSIIIFYIWLGTSGVAKQQNTIDGAFEKHQFTLKMAEFLKLNQKEIVRGAHGVQWEGGSVKTDAQLLSRTIKGMKDYQVDSADCKSYNPAIEGVPTVQFYCKLEVGKGKKTKQAQLRKTFYLYVPESLQDKNLEWSYSLGKVLPLNIEATINYE